MCKKPLLAAALAALLATPGHAAIVITEVDAAGSGTAYGADWFELTNTGATAVNLTGWKMDDNSNSFGSSVALRGVTSIGAGQSVVFFEGNATGSTDATIAANFNAAWGTSLVYGVSIGAYGGSGVGLSTAGDAVNIFDAAGNRVTGVAFGAAPAGATFDNRIGLGGTTLPLPTIATASVLGTGGAYTSLTTAEIGSPGSIAAVPEPEAASMFFAGLALTGVIARRRRRA